MIQILPIIAIATASAASIISIGALISHLRNISKKEGYEKASMEFEKKYRAQYESFMRKEKTWEKNKKEYDDLVNAYKKFAEELRRENEDLKKNGEKSAYSQAVRSLNTTIVLYSSNMGNKIPYYENCLADLRRLKENDA